MKALVAPPRRLSDRFVWNILTLAVLSIPALAQTQQVLGNSQVLNLLDTNNIGMAEAFPVTASSSGQVNYLSLYLDGSNTATTISVGLYTSYYHHPSTLLRQAVIAQPVAGRWNSVQIPGVQVTQGRRYWVAVLGLNGRIEFRDSNSGWCHSETSYQTALTSLPARWWTGSRYSSCLVSMFGSGGVSSTVSVSVSPQTSSLQPAQQAQFTASVNGTTNTVVTWKTSGGTVTSSGLYTAPSSNGTYTVTATSAADSTKSASATITVSQPTQVSVSVSPGAANIQTGGQQQFTASVFGTSNTGVAWKANGGTVTTTGLYTAPSTAGTYTVTADQCSGFNQIGFRDYHGLATHSGVDFRFSRGGECSNRRAATIHRFRVWNEQHRRGVEGHRWNGHDDWPVHCSRHGRHLHGNCHECSGFNQIGFRDYHGLATHSGVDFRFSRGGEYSNRRAATIHRFRVWNEQHRRDVESDRWNGHHDWPVHCSLHGRHLHRNCDQCSGFNQIGFCVYHGRATHSGVDFRFSGHGESPGRGPATVHRDDLRDEQHSGDVDGIWWHNHDERTVHSAHSRGYLHGKGRKRSKQLYVRFCYGQRVGTTACFDKHIPYDAGYAGKVATAIFCHSFRVHQHWRNLDGLEGHWDDHSIGTVHRTASCRN